MSALEISRLTRNDLGFAQQLRELAGWNQTDADWERLLAHEPDGCFVCELDGTPVGTATTTRHGIEVGWIGMVLVDPAFRRRGAATRLLEECIDFLTPRVECIKLDATPAGMKVYSRLGFVEEWRLHRWRCDSLRSTASIAKVNASLDFDWLRNLDSQAFGADRSDYLRRLAVDSVCSVVETHGYGMLRAGAHSHYLGPVVADSSKSGRTLVSTLLPSEGAVIWDIPDENHDAVAFASELGFSKERPLIRMRLGTACHGGDPSLQWGIAGPETG